MPAMQKIERLLNLLALLLHSALPVPLEKIRTALYQEESEEAFRRKFERDKAELREAGIPVERASTDVWDIEEGYLIPRREALLEDPGLTSDEQAALSLAARAWEKESGASVTALLKLSAASGASDEATTTWILPRVAARLPNLDALLDAVARRKRVTFSYRTGGAAAPAKRRLEPHSVGYRGAWYVAGHDQDRGENRVFRVDRIEGRVTVASGDAADFPPPETSEPAIPRHPWEGESELTAVVALGPEAAWWAERRTGARRLSEGSDGWVEVELPVGDPAAFVAWVLGFGDQAELRSPAELRAETRAILEALAG